MTQNVNRLHDLFEKKPKDILSVFLTAGYPQRDSTVEIIRDLYDAGIDMVEIGIPFSDPMADGPVIQASSTKAIENGISVALIREQVAEARTRVADMPFVMMGYINPILQYGLENFFKDFKKAGADGVIIPDLPFEVYINEIKPLSDAYELPVIMLITPETSDERIRLIDRYCEGFIYMVSAASTTGTRDSFSESQKEYFKRINSMNLKHPRLIGFGISNPSTLHDAFTFSSGAIIGSLFIKCLGSEPSVKTAVNKLITTLTMK